jgi:hypothetical protein
MAGARLKPRTNIAHVREGTELPPFRPDTRHNLERLRLCSTGLCLTTTNESN